MNPSQQVKIVVKMNLVKTTCLVLLLSEIGKLFVSFILLYMYSPPKRPLFIYKRIWMWMRSVREVVTKIAKCIEALYWSIKPFSQCVVYFRKY